VADNFGAVDYVVNSFSIFGGTQLATDSFDYTLDRTAATAPIVTDTDDATNDLTLTLTSGSDVSAAISGVTAGDYVYLIKSDQTTVFDYLTTDPQTALDNLRGLSDELWSRSKVADDNTVDLTALGLTAGEYEVVAMDLAGNFSLVASTTVTVTGNDLSSDLLFDADFAGIDADNNAGVELAFINSSTPAGTASSGDSTAKVVINLNDVAEGDTLELWVDGDHLALTHVVTDTEIQAGTFTSGEVNFADFDDEPNQIVALELKVKHGDQYVQEAGDVTWEYQW